MQVPAKPAALQAESAALDENQQADRDQDERQQQVAPRRC